MLPGLWLAALACGPAAALDLPAAIRAGDIDALRTAVIAPTDLDRADTWGRTPLIVALQQGNSAAAELLLEKGAGIGHTDAWGRTPLLVATQLKNDAMIRKLLDKGADANAANRNDITPLIAAAQTGNRAALGLLLERGAAPNRVDNIGWTALMWAAYRKDAPAVRLLLDKGADPRVVGRDGATALAIARNRGAEVTLLDLLAASAQPAASASSSASAGTGTVDSAAVTAPVSPTSAGGEPARVPMPPIAPDRIVRGRPDAPVTIVEYTDFQCPYCRFGARVMDEVLARYEGQVRYVMRQLPLPHLHPQATACAQFFEAIALQGAARAWAFHDRIFADQAALAGGEEYLRNLARELGVDLARLERDRTGPVVQARLAADLGEAERYRFDGVPAYLVNGRVIAGAQPAQSFFAAIDAALRD